MPKNSEDIERNAEYQRRKVMSKDDRALISRDLVARDIHEQNQRDGKHTTYEQAEREAARIANKAHRIAQEDE